MEIITLHYAQQISEITAVVAPWRNDSSYFTVLLRKGRILFYSLALYAFINDCREIKDGRIIAKERFI